MLLNELRHIVGSRGVTTDPEALAPHLSEWRGIVTGKAQMMVAPASTQEISAVMAACAAHGSAVVPQGGNTGLCGGAIPDASGEQVLLSLSRMNRVRAIDRNDFSIVVEAGCILANVQAAAREADRIFPLSLAAEGSCQIGGNLATNAGGINVIRYGTARSQVLGLEVVLADGTILDMLRSLRKDTAGYDLKQLFLGSEGTLGIISAATLRLYPDPGPITTLLLAIDSPERAVEVLARCREEIGDNIQAFELMSSLSLELVLRHIPDTRLPFTLGQPWYVLADLAVGCDESPVTDMLTRLLDAELLADGLVAKNSAEAERLWRLRHAIPEAEKLAGGGLKHDVAVPISRIGEFLTRGAVLVSRAAPHSRLVAFGHVGDGNMHFNVLQPDGADPAEFRNGSQGLSDEIYALVTEFDGTISAEHGIGTFKKAALARYRSGPEIDLMRALKRALDRDNLLNPGKVI